jgi:hypothetical protein
MIPPAAGLAARQLRSLWTPRAGAARWTVALVTLVLLLVHTTEAWQWYANEHPSHQRRLYFMPAELADLTGWIRANTGTDGRILITQAAAEVATGALAHVAVLTDRAMIAYAPYNRRWGYGRFLAPLTDDPSRIRTHLDFLNVRYIVTGPGDTETSRGLERDGVLRLRASWPQLAIYETDIVPTYLIGGPGTVTFDYNRIAVVLDAPRDQVVLKFQWQPGLFAVPPLPIEPADVGALVPLIRVRPGNVRAFEIRY